MQRMFLRIAALAAIVIATPAFGQTTRLNGDVNNDGQVSAADAQAVLNAVVDLSLPAGYDKTFGDADCDGKISARDAQIILSSVVQLDVSAFCVAKPAGAGVALVTVDFGTGTVLVGGDLQLTATARDSTNKELTGRTVAWTTSDATKATVTAAGVVKGVAVGTVTIKATVDGKEGVAVINVNAAGGTGTFTISPASVTVLKDSTVQLVATIRDAAGNPVTGKTITWATSDAAKATVTSAGLVKGLTLGTVTITASSQGFTDATAQVSIVSLAATANRTWTGAVSTDWGTAGNWTPSGVPIATDTISVPAAPPNQPVLGAASATVAGIVVQTGAKLTIGANELQVTGRVDVDGEVIGTGKLTIQGLNQSTSYVRGKLPNVGVAGKTVIVGPTSITGSLDQVAGSIIDLNGFTVTVSKDLGIRGALIQSSTTSILDVRGNARFFTDQATTQTVLSAGTLKVGGNFAVSIPPAGTGTVTSPFPSTGTHRTILDGAAKQTVADTGLTIVTFQELLIQNTAGGVEFTAPPTTIANQAFYVTSRLTASTATAISGPARVVVKSHFTSATGGSVTLRNLSVGGVLSAGADFKPDTMTFIGVAQAVPAGQAYQYQTVVAAGSASLTGTTNLTGGLVLGCITSLAGCNGAGTLDVAGKKLFVAKNLQQSSNQFVSSLFMKTNTDSVVVGGGVLGRLAAPDTSEFDVSAGSWNHGWLRVGGDVRLKGTGPGSSAQQGVTHTVIMDGSALQKLQSKTGFVFQNLTIADSLGVVMNDTTAQRTRIVSVAADLNINTAVKLTGSGRMEVAGNVQTTTGSSVENRVMSVGSILRASGAFTPDTAEFTSPTVVQTIQNLPAYKNVVVKGKAIAGGSMTFSGALIVAPGAELNLEGRHVQVTKKLLVNGVLRMQSSADTLTVLSDSAIFAGTIANVQNFATAGLLRVGGALVVDSAAFYPTGSHRIQVIGATARRIRGGFQDLEIANSAVDTLKNVILRGSLSGSTPATIVMDTIRVDGDASFAEATTLTAKPLPANPAVVAQIKGNLTAAKALTLDGGALSIGGNLSFGPSSSITNKRLLLKGTLGGGDGVSPDTLALHGTTTLPAGGAYKRVTVTGAVTLGGNATATSFAVRCDNPIVFPFSCNTVAPSFDLNGKKLTVTGAMDQANGKVIMTRPADTLNVRGNFTIGKVWARTYSAGVIQVGGNLVSSQSTIPGDTAVAFAVRNTDGSYSKGTKLVFDGAPGSFQSFYGADPEFIASDIDLLTKGANNQGGVTFGPISAGSTSYRVLGSMIITRALFSAVSINVNVAGDIVLRDSAWVGTANLVYKGGLTQQGVVLGNAGTRQAKLKTIRWVTQPTDRVAGQAFSPALQIEAVDSTNARLDAQVPIAVAMNGKTQWYVTTNGLLTLTGVAPTVTQTAFAIPATSLTPGNSSSVQVNSSTFNVTAAAGTHVAIYPISANAVAGTNLKSASSTGLLVRIVDQYGNSTNSGSGTVSVAAGVGSPGALLGTTSGAFATGTTTLTNVQATKAGVYSIVPTVSGLTSFETDTFRVVPAPTNKLVMKTQPVSATVGTFMATSPVFEMQDQYDNVATNLGAFPVVSVVLNRVSGTGPATLTPTFQTSQTAGVVTLTNFKVGTAVGSPTVYTATITLTNYGSINVVTGQFTISP